MSRNRRLLLLLIIVLLGVSIWIMTPNGSSVLHRGTEDLGLTLGLDLRGGSELIYQVKFSDNATADDKAQVMDAVVTTIERRVNKYGVVEPVVQQQGEDRILIQLPGITNVEEAKSLMEQTAFLEFREVELNGSDVATLQNYLDDPGRTAFFDSSVSGSRIFYVYGGSQDPVVILNLEDGALTYTDKDGNTVDPGTLGSDVSGAYSWMPALGAIGGVEKPLTGAYLTKAQREVQQNKNTGVTTIGVGIQWNSEGADIFNQIAARLYPSYSGTSLNPRNLLGIVVDGQMISHPRIMQASYENGNAEITGDFTLNEARTLAVQLTSGQLVAPLIKPPLYEQNVSATLGADFVHKALVAGVVGLLVVILFMVLYYRVLGVLAAVALLIYAALALAIFKLIPVTLTLAGIGGFVVSLGMAVDANCLIFERMKEELRAGSTVGAAAEAGFNRAWSAIRDSNITTFIACAVLYWLGSHIAESSQVKGFGLTLFIGVAVSMFTAITVTHGLVRLVVATGLGARLLRPWMTQKTDGQGSRGGAFGFVGRKRWFFLASAIVILAGLISVLLPHGLKLGADFEESSSFVLRFSPSVTEASLTQALGEAGYAGGRTTIQQATGADYVDFTIRTRLLNEEEQDSLTNYLEQQLGPFETISSGRTSATVAAETVRNAVIAVAVASLAILLYMAWAFRKMPKPFRYGTCAILSLVHDLLVVLAVFSVFGRVFNLEINAMFITACLAVLGYSVNDTVVVFDRIRENIQRGISDEFAVVINYSLTETLTRSLNTTFTTLLACLAVYLFVGGPMTSFMLALLVGFASGAYSSLLASQLLALWERVEWFRFLPRIPLLQRIKA